METSADAPGREAASSTQQDSVLDQAFHSLLEPICTTLARIEKSLDGRAPRAEGGGNAPAEKAAPSPPPAIDAAAEILRRIDALQTTMTHLWERMTLALDPHLTEDRPATDGSTSAMLPDQPERWERILLDEDLATEPSLADSRRQFLQDVLDDVAAARVLAGHLMIVRSVAHQDLPEMLRHVGEAYYRWRPRAAGTSEDPFESGLAEWLNRLAEKAGLPNSIQLVRPGERFDNARHIAAGRGVEIVAVHGWVVLRDRIKVYTRANVTVR